MTINDAKTLTIKLNTKKLNIGLVKQNLTYTAILPQHIWAGLEKSEKSLIGYSNMKPVGSGPYLLSSANNERVVLQRFEKYWGKKVYGMPAPKYGRRLA